VLSYPCNFPSLFLTHMNHLGIIFALLFQNSPYLGSSPVRQQFDSEFVLLVTLPPLLVNIQRSSFCNPFDPSSFLPFQWVDPCCPAFCRLPPSLPRALSKDSVRYLLSPSLLTPGLSGNAIAFPKGCSFPSPPKIVRLSLRASKDAAMTLRCAL